MVGHATIGAVNEVVNVAERIVKDSVAQGYYKLCRDCCEGSPRSPEARREHRPHATWLLCRAAGLFQFAELYMRRFPEFDPLGKPLAAQTGPAP
jgi:hypothetical protein